MGITQWGALAMLGTAATLGTAGHGGQQPATQKLDVAKVTAQLGVTGESKTAVTTDLNHLNDLLAQRATARNQLGQVSRNLSEVFQDLAGRLTPEQRATLRQALRDANGSAGWGGRMGYGYMGHMASSYMMGSGSGAYGGCWGNGGMGAGMGSCGGHMGGRYMGGNMGVRGPSGSR
jgi:hypothetical protein